MKHYSGTMTMDLFVEAESEDEAIDLMYERLGELIDKGISQHAFGSYINHVFYSKTEKEKV